MWVDYSQDEYRCMCILNFQNRLDALHKQEHSLKLKSDVVSQWHASNLRFCTQLPLEKVLQLHNKGKSIRVERCDHDARRTITIILHTTVCES